MVARGPLDKFADVDPFYGGVWTSPVKVGWSSIRDARAAEAGGLGKLPPHWRVDEVTAWSTIMQCLPDVVEAVGALNQWKSLSVQQLERLTGRDRLGVLDSRGRSLLAAMFTVGLIDFGSPMLPLRAVGPVHPARVLVALGRTEVFERRIAPLLTFPEMVRITGGGSFTASRLAERHNMLAAELGLRLAADGDVVAVLGESMSTLRQLAYESVGNDAPKGMNASADLTVVRADGVRVAIEVQASVSPGFKDKVFRWARALAQAPRELSGLMVVFVEAAPINRPDAYALSVRRDIRQAVVAAVRQFPGSSTDRVAERIGVASWRDWFTADGGVAAGFAPLRVQRPLGGADDRWVTTDVLDVFDLPWPLKDSEGMVAVRDNARALAGSPVMLEARVRGTPPNLLGWCLDAHDLVPLPLPPPSRGGSRVLSLDAAVPTRCEVGREAASLMADHV